MSFGRNIDWYRERVAVGGQVRYRYVREFHAQEPPAIRLPAEWCPSDIQAQFAFVEVFSGYAVRAVFGEEPNRHTTRTGEGVHPYERAAMLAYARGPTEPS